MLLTLVVTVRDGERRSIVWGGVLVWESEDPIACPSNKETSGASEFPFTKRSNLIVKVPAAVLRFGQL